MTALHDASLTHAPRRPSRTAEPSTDGVPQAAASGLRVMMCPPPQSSAADLHQWGRRMLRYDAARAATQWAALRETIAGLGVEVVLPAERPDEPDQMVIGDAAILAAGKAIAARFAQPRREGELVAVRATLDAAGFEIATPPPEMVLEAGQVAVSHFTLFGGWFENRERLGLTWAARQLALRLVALRLASDQFDRLDLCFRPLRPEMALCLPQAFEPADFKTLRESVSMLLAVPIEEAARGACSVVTLGRDVLLPTGCDRTAGLLDAAGFAVHTVDVSEFRTIGSSLAGLVLPLATPQA